MECIICNKILTGNQTKFCSNKCNGIYWRSQPEYKERINKLRKEWIIKNKEKVLEYQREWERKNYNKRKKKNDRWLERNPHYQRDYHKRPNAIKREQKYRNTENYRKLSRKNSEKWRNKNPEYNKIFRANNLELIKKLEKEYRKSNKGIMTRIIRNDKKANRNILYLGMKGDEPKGDLIKMLKERDKTCVYCHCEFDYSNHNNIRYPTFDHVNCKLPLNKNNAVICCRLCNASKNDTEVLEWCKHKGYTPDKIIYDLLNLG